MIHSPGNVKQLISLTKKKNVKYLFFWGHKQRTPEVTKTCLSQWYPSPFYHNPNDQSSTRYATAEHYMMVQKAVLFHDYDIAKKILADDDPARAKELGRQVSNFDSAIWNAKNYYTVFDGNVLKFSQNPELKDYLLSTGKRILVEASPNDKIWGIGMTEDHSDACNPARWKGENLLGFALMKARSYLLRKR
ncbi:NADAR family protein [Kordiimonas sp. SCSIO 12610]|uniref:NADAR family protein n=1 Tax=Kordiimonas sp. SCSIO 12610 TaxID=2829597 RepID=UPI00210D6FFA|nr:NADAR family protein [Kordiimonas sp. SCSIO 12610]UTW54380.1 NADAR family protein [Kordiimonas sp. SCSIO 12610]